MDKTVRWSRREGFLPASSSTGGWNLPVGATVEQEGEFHHVAVRGEHGERQEFWVDWETGFIYKHRPVVRYRGFVKLLYDGDMVYVLNIHEERFIPYHNWEIRADARICTIGNRLYFSDRKDGRALRIQKRSGDFQMFMLYGPLHDDTMVMVINKHGKEPEMKRIERQE